MSLVYPENPENCQDHEFFLGTVLARCIYPIWCFWSRIIRSFFTCAMRKRFWTTYSQSMLKWVFASYFLIFTLLNTGPETLNTPLNTFWFWFRSARGHSKRLKIWSPEFFRCTVESLHIDYSENLNAVVWPRNNIYRGFQVPGSCFLTKKWYEDILWTCRSILSKNVYWKLNVFLYLHCSNCCLQDLRFNISINNSVQSSRYSPEWGEAQMDVAMPSNKNHFRMVCENLISRIIDN